MQTPVEIVSTNGGNIKYYVHYGPDVMDNQVYRFDALEAANTDPTCGNSGNQVCAHALLEVWQSSFAELDVYVNEHNSIINAGPLGIFGHVGWWYAHLYRTLITQLPTSVCSQ
jgi:hypothetical protein